MSEIESGSLREFFIKAGVVVTLASAAAGWVLYENSKPSSVSATPETDMGDGRPSNYINGFEEKSQPQNQTGSVPEHTPGYMTRSDPRARYKIVPDPLGLGRICVTKTNESPANTLVGMTVVVAGDPNKYDGSGVIYDGAGNQIGVWDTSKLIGFEDLTAPAEADSVACADN